MMIAGRLSGPLLLLAALTPAAASPGQPPLVDVTAEAGLEFVHFSGMTGHYYFAEIMGAGGGILDYDGDGDPDLYLVQGASFGDDPVSAALRPPVHPLPLTDRLYRNDGVVDSPLGPTPRFVDVTDSAGLTAALGAAGYGMGILAGDLDDDGDPDLYRTALGSNTRLVNQGDGTFAALPDAGGAQDTRWSTAASLFDAEGDGDLDLWVGNYVAWTVSEHRVCRSVRGEDDWCGPLAYPPVADRLFCNEGGRFEDVTTRALEGMEDRATLGAASGDFDGDGDLDLYVAADLMPNGLWLNRGDGTFTDEALLGGAATAGDGSLESSMGVAAVDLDDDGDEDLFTTHVVEQTNTLYLNDGDALFTDRSRESGLGGPSWNATGFGVVFLDLDPDGLLDAVVVNGAVNTQPAQRAAGDDLPLHQRDQVFRNLGDGRFEEISDTAGGPFERSEVGRGLAVGDVDLDGDDDLLLTNNSGPARLLRNDGADGGEWIAFRLLSASGRDALGAEVVARTSGAAPRLRRIRTGGSYLSSRQPRAIFGLGPPSGDGTADRVDVRLRWPEGARLEMRGLAAGRTYLVPYPGGPS